jgi:hypothetical protein
MTDANKGIISEETRKAISDLLLRSNIKSEYAGNSELRGIALRMQDEGLCTAIGTAGILGGHIMALATALQRACEDVLVLSRDTE